jgi:hypothetical protein
MIYREEVLRYWKFFIALSEKVDLIILSKSKKKSTDKHFKV